MKSTPLTELHRHLGAKMVEFAGYEMPISYSGLKEEHFAVRRRAGLFDVSHMGEFIIRGPQALELVQYVTSNDAAKLTEGQAQYSCLPNERGGIVDDLIVYRLPQNPMMDHINADEPAFMLVVNSSNIDKDWNWIRQHNTFDAEMINISDNTGLLAVQGPAAADILQPLTDEPLRDIKYYHFRRGSIAGLDNVIISATGYTGSGGFELYCAADRAAELWNAILETGRLQGLMPAGLGARDTLRLEMGYALYGNDINDDTSPLEAGLGWITKLQKGDFIGRDAILRQKEAGIRRRLVGFTLDERRAPRHGYAIENAAGETVGEVASGTHSPMLDQPIGMGYVPVELQKEGTEIHINVGRKSLPARVVKVPFVNPQE